MTALNTQPHEFTHRHIVDITVRGSARELGLPRGLPRRTVACAAALLQIAYQRRQLLLLASVIHELGTPDKNRGPGATGARTQSDRYARTAATTNRNVRVSNDAQVLSTSEAHGAVPRCTLQHQHQRQWQYQDSRPTVDQWTCSN